jgi:hypothetical protein
MSADNRVRAAAHSLIYSDETTKARREAQASLARHMRGDGLRFAHLFDRAAEQQQILEHREWCARRALLDAHDR